MANRKHFQTSDVSGSASKKSEDKSLKKKFKRKDKRGRLLIRNLPLKVTEAEVRKLFGKYGKVTAVQLPHRSAGNLLGCGFVQFSNRNKAAKAVANTNGQDFMGQTLDVSFALSNLDVAGCQEHVPLPGTTGAQAPADSSVHVLGGGDHPGVGPVKVEPGDGNVKQEPADDASTTKIGENKKKEKPLQKRGRLIVRNLPFKVTEATLKEHFEAFGEVHDVKLLRRPDGKLVGCGFVQYTWKQNAAKAILKTSGKSFMGRTIIVDWAVPKNVFEAKMHEEEEVEVKNEPQDDTVTIKEEVGEDMENAEHSDSKQLRKQSSHSTSESSSESDVDSEFQEDRDGTMGSDVESVGAEHQVRRQTLSNDVVEGCTVFVKNIPFSVTNEQLKECMEQFGQLVYALVCVDPLTEHSKGTGFVKFKNKESAERCLSAGGELMLEDQELQALPALPKQEMMDRAHARKESARGRDTRNLYLVKEGVVLAGSTAATGVSAADMARRLQLEQWKTQILRNLNMFVSRTRLVVHNLPPSWDDDKLRQLFAQHSPPGTIIKEARVMRDLRDVDLKGIARSKEYGFVTFGSHEAALQTLRSINNNPKIFTPAKRPIVSFSIENKAILNLKQRRLMKSRDKNPLASRTEGTGAAGMRRGKEALGRSQWQDSGDVGQGEGSEKFAGVVARPGKVKMRSRFNLRTQAARHSETLRQEKRKRKDQRRATQLRRSVIHKNTAELQVKKKKGKLKGEQKSEAAFSKLVDKYKSKLSTLSAVEKWYE